ncbi:unnamed protein product [Malus baccata var. baccata]
MDLMSCWNRSTRDYSTVIGAKAASSNKLPSSSYKGVVPHHRVWLGTFDDEEEAAKTYNIASLKFRGLDAITNFSRNQMTPYERDVTEAFFLESHSKAEIVDMLRKHSYANELEMYKHKLYISEREFLFEKVATPSDVGRLNCMVITKQHAEKHFQVQLSVGFGRGVLLKFEDEVGKVWRFGYCYWSSSQSYVLSKGWIRFVNEKKLKAGDVVRLERSVGEDKKLFIDCRPRNVDVLTNPTMHLPDPRHIDVSWSTVNEQLLILPY